VAGVLVVALASRRAIRPTYPLLAGAAIAVLIPPIHLFLASSVATLAIAIPAAWGTRHLARRNAGLAIAAGGAISLGGIWLAVPDTEAAMVAAGVLIPGALVVMARRTDVRPIIGWPLLFLVIALVISVSSGEEPTIAIGAAGCFALLAVAPAVTWWKPPTRVVLDSAGHPRLALAALSTHAVIVLVCARIASQAPNVASAAAIVVASWVVGAALVLWVPRLVTRPETI
jgi:hypothetical protein